MALEGTTSAPHLERTAFEVARIYAALGPDGLSANLELTPDKQELKCLMAPEAFRPVPNAWGEQGWTTVTLAAISRDELAAALRLARQHALRGTRGARTRKSEE